VKQHKKSLEKDSREERVVGRGQIVPGRGKRKPRSRKGDNAWQKGLWTKLWVGKFTRPMMQRFNDAEGKRP